MGHSNVLRGEILIYTTPCGNWISMEYAQKSTFVKKTCLNILIMSYKVVTSTLITIPNLVAYKSIH